MIELIARAVIFNRDRLLCCRSIKKGYLYLPGGHIEEGEDARTALRRELNEEAGLTVSPGPLLAVAEVTFAAKSGVCHEVDLMFHVVIEREEIASIEPKIAFQWVVRSDLSSLDFRPRVIRDWLVENNFGHTAFLSEFPE